jgi:hypothetical protein
LLIRTLKAAGVSGQTWTQLILIGAFTSVAFYLPAFFTCVTPDHRKLMLHSVAGRLFPSKVATPPQAAAGGK